LKNLLLVVAFIASGWQALAQKQVSLLTCGVGDEVYSIYGHSALRVKDSVSDIVYNYGMFDYDDPQFIPKYIRGKLLYFGAKQSFESFVRQYQYEQRSVYEQILQLNDAQVNAIELALAQNDKPENFYYKYDFTYKNCSTKLRDLIEKALGKDFKYNDYIKNDSITFMQVLNTYQARDHWVRVGINLLLSSKVHGKMNSYQSMFLPRGLMQGLDHASLAGAPLVKEGAYIIPETKQRTVGTNWAAICLGALALFLLASTISMPQSKFMRVADAVWFTLLGLLGLLFAFMWLGTDHLQTAHNLHLTWALPTHVAWLGIRNKKWFSKYCALAAVLSLLSCTVIHFLLQPTAIEVLPLIAYTCFRLYQHAKGITRQ
jgi:hypothetical protein